MAVDEAKNGQSDNAFCKNYENKAHHQARIGKSVISEMSDSIHRWMREESCEDAARQRGLRILDLCCGHGKPTYDLLCALREKGVKVDAMVGYDVSAEQIQVAKEKYSCSDDAIQNDNGDGASHTERRLTLHFAVQNVETMHHDNEFDVIVSIFGIHWIKNLAGVAQSIARALRQGGKLLFMVPLEKPDLLAARTHFLHHSDTWSPLVCPPRSEQSAVGDASPTQCALFPHRAHGDEYRSVFDVYFDAPTTGCMTRPATFECTYTKQEFITFLASWMPEVRFLEQRGVDNAMGYVEDLVNTIPLSGTKHLRFPGKDREHVIFSELLFYYEGQKKKRKSEVQQ